MYVCVCVLTACMFQTREASVYVYVCVCVCADCMYVSNERGKCVCDEEREIYSERDRETERVCVMKRDKYI